MGSPPMLNCMAKTPQTESLKLGEKILWFVPKKKRVKLDARWRYGVFLGRSMNTDYNYVGLSDGTVVCARAMVRVIPSKRWDVKRLMGLRGTPNHEKLRITKALRRTWILMLILTNLLRVPVRISTLQSPRG